MAEPKRGDVWMGNLNPVVGHEQAGRRPLLIVSDDAFNSGLAGLVIVIPITTRFKNIPFHVTIVPPDGGLRSTSFAKCEDIRSIAKDRLEEYCGYVMESTISDVEECLRMLIRL